MLKHIQLSRPSNTEDGITDGAPTRAHTAREYVGSLSRSNWALRRMLVEVRYGEDSPKTQQELGLQGRSHTDEAAPTKTHTS